MAKHPRRLEAGALSVGLWLLAAVTASAAPTIDYLPAVGAAPLLFQPPATAGRPAGWPPLPRPDDSVTNVTTLATNVPALTAPAATNRSVLPPPVKVAAPAPAPVPPPITAAAPDPAAPPDPSQLSLPPLTEPASPANTMIDMASLLRWLSPAYPNPVAGSILFPSFVPATPPPSSTAVYESR
ncbi:MAG: hypothetical protein WCT12_21120 [Verrucomicrobiota bacterium]